MDRSFDSIYKGIYEGRYCAEDDIDVSDSAEPAQCPVCGSPAERISEERYFFRLSRFKDRLTALYLRNPEFVRFLPQPDGAIKTFLGGELEDISISRRLRAGIPWPGDSEHTVAPLVCEFARYLSAIGFGEGRYTSREFERYWPADLHVACKDELTAHATVWPALLMAADLPVPRHIVACASPVAATGTSDESKEIAAVCQIAEALGADAVRDHLLRNISPADEACFVTNAVIQNYKVHLSSGIGSLANRILLMVDRYCDGKIPTPHFFPDLGEKIMIALWDVRPKVRVAFDNSDFRRGLSEIWSFIAAMDKFVSDNQPDVLAHQVNQIHRLENVLYDACEGLASMAMLLYPVLPETAETIWKALGQESILADQQVDASIWGILPSGAAIRRPCALLPSIDEKEAAPKMEETDRVLSHP